MSKQGVIVFIVLVAFFGVPFCIEMRRVWRWLFRYEVSACRSRGIDGAPLSDCHPRTRYHLGYLPQPQRPHHTS